jgi:hypothetical protein
MMNMKNLSILFYALLFCCVAVAQQNITIFGNVINEVTGQPMQAASVFAQNTTIGTATSAEGNFTLQLPAGGYDLIVSYTGYRTESRRITSADASEKITIKLKEKEKELEAVAIISTNEVADGFAKYGQFFKEEFIGKTNNSALCNIQNPEVLHFFYSKKRNRLKITATEPLIMRNDGLGYNIKYALDSFVHEYKTALTIYTGYPLFENIAADSMQIKRWELARSEAYRGSMLHFMRSVFNKSIKEQAFEIQFIINQNEKESALKLKDVYGAINYAKDDSTNTVEILPNQNNVGVLYFGTKPSIAYTKENAGEPTDFKFSMLAFKQNESIIIEQNGYFYEQNDITASGYWAWDKIAEMLPYDYREER